MQIIFDYDYLCTYGKFSNFMANNNKTIHNTYYITHCYMDINISRGDHICFKNVRKQKQSYVTSTAVRFQAISDLCFAELSLF